MAVFIIALLLGLCLVLAGGITLLRTAFMRLSRDNMPATLIAQQDRILSALTVGYLFFVLSAIILMTHFLLYRLNNWQLALHCVILTAVIVPLTDVFPRSYLLSQSAEVNATLLPWIRIAFKIFHYPAMAMTFLGRQLMRVFKSDSSPPENIFNSSEYYPLISRYYESNAATGTIEKKDHDIQQILTRFTSLPVTEIMTKAADLKVMDAALPGEELIKAIFESNSSRVLLYQDRAENIAGIVHSPLLMKSFCLAEGDKNQTDITSAISEPVFIEGDISVFDQLQNFSRHHEHFALIRKNDKLIGAIAMETILEKLFAELKERAAQNEQ